MTDTTRQAGTTAGLPAGASAVPAQQLQVGQLVIGLAYQRPGGQVDFRRWTLVGRVRRPSTPASRDGQQIGWRIHTDDARTGRSYLDQVILHGQLVVVAP